MTFIKQTTKYNCGPTAIYNTLVYYGIPLPSISFLTELAECTETGTSEENITKCLDFYKDYIEYEEIRKHAPLRVTVVELEQHLKDEKNIALHKILAGRSPGGVIHSHYILSIYSDGDTFTVVNDTKAVEVIPQIWMASYLEFGGKDKVPATWLIKGK